MELKILDNPLDVFESIEMKNLYWFNTKTQNYELSNYCRYKKEFFYPDEVKGIIKDTLNMNYSKEINK